LLVNSRIKPRNAVFADLHCFDNCGDSNRPSAVFNNKKFSDRDFAGSEHASAVGHDEIGHRLLLAAHIAIRVEELEPYINLPSLAVGPFILILIALLASINHYIFYREVSILI